MGMSLLEKIKKNIAYILISWPLAFYITYIYRGYITIVDVAVCFIGPVIMFTYLARPYGNLCRYSVTQSMKNLAPQLILICISYAIGYYYRLIPCNLVGCVAMCTACLIFLFMLDRSKYTHSN